MTLYSVLRLRKDSAPIRQGTPLTEIFQGIRTKNEKAFELRFSAQMDGKARIRKTLREQRENDIDKKKRILTRIREN